MTLPATYPSGGELVARLHLAMQKHGGQVIQAVLSDHAAWVVTRGRDRRVTIAHLASRPTGCVEPELVVTCEPFADPYDCPAALPKIAALIETNVLPRAVLAWRLRATQKNPRPLAMQWGVK